MPGIRLDFGEKTGKYLVVLLFLMMHFLMQREKEQAYMSRYMKIYINVMNVYMYIHIY